MAGICPCCGNALNIPEGIVFRAESNTLLSSDYAVVFSTNQSRIFDLLWKARNAGRLVTKEQIFETLYSRDPNGGPEPKVIDTMICQMRRMVRATDIEIAPIYREGYFLRMKNTAAPPRIVSTRRTQQIQANCG